MSIHNQDTIESGQGFTKEIEESALPLILDNLQIYQYQYPIKSTVRELASNAYDSIQEKRVAMDILSGRSKPEDHFINRQDDMYKDSNWNPSYYDLKHLHPHNNEVLIEYVEGKTHDTVRITDYGVGIGGKRLAGYFKLGWSTKRNSKFALGKFGIGAKVALSTGAAMFTMESVYNGHRYKFNVYAHKVDSIIPPFDMSTTLPNNHIFIGPPEAQYKVHYENTSEYNYTRVSFQVKKHHKSQYIQAVQGQLLYFPSVRFEMLSVDGTREVIPYRAEVLHEDQYLVVSNNKQYTKPHLIINNVCYGYVDWIELELEDRNANVGIKVAMEDVTVNPSRETVIWNDHTRSTVLDIITKSIESAEKIVENEMNTDNLMEWMQNVVNISIKQDESVIGRLAAFSGETKFSPRIEVAGRKLRLSDLMFIFKTVSRSVEKGSIQKVSKKYRYDSTPVFAEDLFIHDIWLTEEDNRTYKKRKYITYTHVDCIFTPT